MVTRLRTLLDQHPHLNTRILVSEDRPAELGAVAAEHGIDVPHSALPELLGEILRSQVAQAG